jgi:sugar transferase (PEP-CTERM system associated)
MFIPTPRFVVLLTGETFLLLTAVITGTFVQLGALAVPALSDGGGILRVALIVAVCQLCLHYADLYDLPRVRNIHVFLARFLPAIAATSLILALLYLCFPRWTMGPGVFLIASALIISLVPSWRLTFGWLMARAAPRERLLIVGTNPAAVDLARELNNRRHELGVEIVGFADSTLNVGQTVLGGTVQAVADLPAMIRTSGADRVVVSLADARGKLPIDQLLDIRLQANVTFDHLASVYEEYTGKIALETLRPSWFLFSSGFRKTRARLMGKRALDVALALAGLVVGAPVLLTAAAAVKLTSRGPALYRQDRVGLNGRIFTIYKLRTMRADAEAGTGPIWSALNDRRITPVGRFLRQTRIDELPQLWNVLRGDMSVIGPRPERPEFVTQLTAAIPFFSQRHVVKPGITGWAQVHHAYAASIEDTVEKLQYDLYYIKNLSLWLDVLILAETVKTVVRQRGAR